MPAREAGPAPEVALAERHDAAGRHDEAIDQLARAAQRGDIEATTRLAKRLIVGDRAPLLPREGIGLLETAAEQGGPEAAGRLAVLAAAGARGKHDWPRAVTLLVLSAERGWEPARGQLAVLSSAGQRNVAPSPAAARDWRGLGAAIDFSAWAAVPRAEPLHPSARVFKLPEFLPRRVCEWLVAGARPKLVRALVYDPVGRRDVADATRTNTAAGFNLMETDLVHLTVQARMAEACGLPLAQFEGATVLHYDVGEEIANHFDFVDPATPNYDEELRSRGQRVVTFLVYLNDEYGGGETEFPEFGLRHKGRLGEGLFFVNALEGNEPDLRMVHAGRPPTSGEKWVLSQFVRNLRVLHVVS